MHKRLISLTFIIIISSCAQHAGQNVQPGMAKNDGPVQQQFEADKKICWAEISDKYNCFPPFRGVAITRGQEDVYDLFIEAKRFCGKTDNLSPSGGGSEGLLRLISYMGECLTKNNWANLWCCDQY
jgi:hypothetical protein